MAFKFNEIIFGLLPVKCSLDESMFPDAAIDCAECKRLGLADCSRQIPCSSCAERSTANDCVYPTAARERSRVQPSPDCQFPTGNFTEIYLKRLLLDLGLTSDQVGEFTTNGVLPDGFDLPSLIPTLVEGVSSGRPATPTERDGSNSDSPPFKPPNIDTQSLSTLPTLLSLLKQLTVLANALGPEVLASWQDVGEARELLQRITTLFGVGSPNEGPVEPSLPQPPVLSSASTPKQEAYDRDNHSFSSATGVQMFDDFSVTWTADPEHWEAALKDLLHRSVDLPAIMPEDEVTESNPDEDDSETDTGSMGEFVPELDRLCGEIHNAARTTPHYTMAALRLAKSCRILTNGYHAWEKVHLAWLKMEVPPPGLGRMIIAKILFKRQVQRDLERVLAFLNALNDQPSTLSEASKQQLFVAFQNASKFLIVPRPFFYYSEDAIKWTDTLLKWALQSE